MISEEIKKELFMLQDEKYRVFQSKLIPSIDAETVIGVRTPELRRYAKKLLKQKNITDFLNDLPHQYFDENQLHGFIVSEIKDYIKAVNAVNNFLPWVDNWATCDQMSPKTFKNHKSELLESIKQWIDSEKTYTIRFGIGMLMRFYLDEDFDPEYPIMVAKIKSEEYYVNMMRAWYFATALAKHYEIIIPYIEDEKLDIWTHNKLIQKALESYRITQEQKTYLKDLKIKTK
ncbi:MAG: DNA alkylation repair protein [Lachnospiraceae bacterium]|nr:DNA alkylation repair protein [Lachnospiraceae bacterium]